jgi:lipopolysaccharide/colanic/teichoic acid biosynthesis glycosyltransferase
MEPAFIKTMVRFLEKMNVLNYIRDARIFREVHSSQVFASILNRERDRADRTNQEFSMVVFEIGAGNDKSESTRHLVTLLTQRIRSTDDIGWLESGNLGVVLPHTSPDGAWKFVDNLRSSYNGKLSPPDCQVYSYPSWWLPTGNERHSRKSVPGTAPTDDFPGGGLKAVSSNGADCVRPMEELESHFLCRIPAWKRAIDISGSLCAIVLLSPLFLLVALLIKITSPGPIFFRQERIGYLGKLFTIWKFRTMHVNADTTVHKQHLQDLINNEKEMTKLDNEKDSRIIPFGTILRLTGIDELPQLFNVLMGDMSLVGPRPCLSYEAKEFHPWQIRRFDTVPGLTGLWQVSGKNRTTFKEMMRLDIAYTRKRAFWLDMKIFIKTLPAIADQVASRPSFAHARAKGISIFTRLGALILTLLSLNRLHR